MEVEGRGEERGERGREERERQKGSPIFRLSLRQRIRVKWRQQQSEIIKAAKSESVKQK